MYKIWLHSVVVIALSGWFAPLAAQPFDNPLPQVEQEERAQALFRELRCMVCQNQSIHDSDAPLAKDMRTLVREQISQGNSDTQIMAFLENRYGEFVLMRPRFAAHTWFLWGAPILVLLLGVGIALKIMMQRKKIPEPEPLSEAEKEKLARLDFE